jgi:hypothetical protein
MSPAIFVDWCFGLIGWLDLDHILGPILHLYVIIRIVFMVRPVREQIGDAYALGSPTYNLWAGFTPHHKYAFIRRPINYWF